MRAYLADFGLARAVSTASALTRTGETLGTPAYMSPEQARGELAALTPASDVWSLGAVLLECVAGRPAFAGDSPAAVIANILAGPARMPPGVPRAGTQLLRACLAAVPEARHASARQLADDLARILAGHRPLGAPPGRRRRAVLAVASLAVAGVAVVAWRVVPRAAAPDRPAARLAADGWALRLVDPAGAEQRLAQALELEPADHAWRSRRGLLLWALGRDAEAATQWAAVPGSDEAGPRARLYLGLQATTRMGVPGIARLAVLRQHLAPLRSAGGPVGRIAQAALAADIASVRRHLDGIDDWEASLVRAIREDLDGEPRPAADAYDDVLRRGVTLVWATANRGNQRREIGDAAGAIEDFTAALALRPAWPDVLKQRADVLLDLGDSDGALADCEAALTVDPAHVASLVTLGQVRTARGEAGGARAAYDAALAADPRCVPALANRGALSADAGDLLAALSDYDAALAIEPGQYQVLANRALLHARRGDAAQAAADFDAALAVQRADPTLFMLRADFRRTHGDPAGALADVAEALRLDPEYEDALFERAELERRTGDATAARRTLDALLRLDPTHPAALGRRADLRRDHGDLPGAIEDYDAALAAAPQWVEALCARAEAQRLRGRPDAALADCERALTLRPGDPWALLYRALARFDGKDPESAAADLRAVLAAMPAEPNALSVLGRILHARGEYDGAAALFDRYLAVAPGHPHADGNRRLLADCRRRLGTPGAGG